jgi:surfeit locus 1 family protein
MRRYAVLFMGFLVAAGCVRLGLWQVSRLKVRQARNTALQRALAQPPVDLVTSLFAASVNRRVTARGRFDFERQVVVEARSFGGTPGVVVVTPFLVIDGPAFMVERGWVPSPDGRAVDLTALTEPDTATIEGILLSPPAPIAPPADAVPFPLRVRWVDPVTLAPRYRYPVAPMVIRRTNPSPLPGLRPVPLPEVGNGPHLAYAIQWFAFAIIAMVGSVVLYRKERREQRGETGNEKGETGNA